jgi:predicted GNAT family acetyltransferase
MILLGPHRRLRSHPDLVVERLETADGMRIFHNLISELFGLPLNDTQRLFPADQLHNDSIRHYVGYLEDVPIVVGTGVQAEGVVSVWNVATHDVVRRQRAATGLMGSLLQEAWEDGCDASLLYSSPMAYSLYQKLGYELYTQRRCFLPPEW